MGFTVWTNSNLAPVALQLLREGLGKHRLVVAQEQTTNLGGGQASESLAEANIAFGQPDPVQMMELSLLKWTQLTSAGYTRYDRQDLKNALAERQAILTNSSSVFDEPCAQHLLAFMLAIARQLPESLVSQLGPRDWSYGRLRPLTKTLDGQTVLIVGYGAIGKRLAELLAPFRVKVIGLRRKVHGDESIPTFQMNEADPLWPQADFVVNILPANPSTDGFFDSYALQRLKQGAIFLNVGRGNTVNQSGLISALQSGQLSAAYLDVTDPEPLPPSHPLWTAPNCYITPHIAGGHQEEDLFMVRHFLRNLVKFEAGEPLSDFVAGHQP